MKYMAPRTVQGMASEMQVTCRPASCHHCHRHAATSAAAAISTSTITSTSTLTSAPLSTSLRG